MDQIVFIIDGNPVAGKNASQYFQIFRSPNVAYNSTTKVVTDQGGGNMFANLTTAQGSRTIQVVAAKKRQQMLVLLQVII